MSDITTYDLSIKLEDNKAFKLAEDNTSFSIKGFMEKEIFQGLNPDMRSTSVTTTFGADDNLTNSIHDRLADKGQKPLAITLRFVPKTATDDANDTAATSAAMPITPQHRFCAQLQGELPAILKMKESTAAGAGPGYNFFIHYIALSDNMACGKKFSVEQFLALDLMATQSEAMPVYKSSYTA